MSKKADETNSIRRFKTYMETYLEFKYDSPFAIPQDNFNKST
jgi:hypothetical protein